MTTVKINGTPKISNYSSVTKTSLATPDWESIPHKGMPHLSDEEFESKIDSLGKALAEARNNSSQYAAIAAEADKVMKQYISLVSPDRKSLVKETTNFLDGNFNNTKKKKIRRRSKNFI